MKTAEEEGRTFSLAKNFPLLMGQACGNIKSVETAQVRSRVETGVGQE
jgi:hypothetical protein